MLEPFVLGEEKCLSGQSAVPVEALGAFDCSEESAAFTPPSRVSQSRRLVTLISPTHPSVFR